MKRLNMLNNMLSIINITAAFFYFFSKSQLLWLLVGIQIIIVIYFLINETSYFVHSLFWPIFSASLLILPWPIAFIFPIVVYLPLVLLNNKYKNEIQWLKTGNIDKTTIMIMIPVIILSSTVLILWVFLCKPDLTDIMKMVPAESVIVIIIIGILFSVFNSMWEEIILKGILWNGLELFISNIIVINLFQAVLFGVMHYNGFPRGVVGAVLAGVYGLLIGFIRKYSKGLLAPIITHFFADATIFALIIFLKG